MAKIEELRAALENAQARIRVAQEAGEVDDERRAFADEEAAAAALIEAQSGDRWLAGKRLERAAKSTAAGAYQVLAVDLMSKLPQIAEDKFPAGGVVVFRSAEVGPRKRFEAVMQADPTPDQVFDANVDLLMACTVEPSFKSAAMAADPAAMAYRRFWEVTGRGLVGLMSVELSKLGGLQLTAFQRASK